MMDTGYFQRANAVVDLLPYVAGVSDFALKGGTALNYFYWNVPRISVDIDLTFIPILERTESIQRISDHLKEIMTRLNKLPRMQVRPIKNGEQYVKLIVNNSGNLVKVEPNPVLRGVVFPTEKRTLVKRAIEFFEREIEIRCQSFADLYGGKICAALDRQHPRDLFDVKLLFDNMEMSEEVRQSFVVYLISHPRPISELLNPNLIDIETIYENEFTGMTMHPVSLKDLLMAREQLIRYVQSELTEAERKFLLSIKMGKPDWELFPIKHIRDLPAVRWKLHNISKINEDKHLLAIDKLRNVLEL